MESDFSIWRHKIHGQAPRYLADHLIPASDAAPRRGRLRSANRNCLTVDSARTARQSGTRCQMNLEIMTILIVLNSSWKQFSLAATSVTSALEVIL